MEQKIEKMEINGVKYIREDCLKKENDSGLKDLKIVILQRGWVAVGDFKREGDDCSLENASIVRRWGTTKGLGELAEKGPLENTILDKCGVLRFHNLTIIATMDCEASKWTR